MGRIARSWQLSCTYSHESRSLSTGLDYTANVSGCMAQFTLR